MPTSNELPRLEGGSYRDPRAHVFAHENKVLRSLNEEAASDYAWLEQSGLLSQLVGNRSVVDTRRATDAPKLAAEPSATVLEHERIPFVSYPYEWTFSALKKAALHHLDLHRRMLDAGGTLTDASAYNIQFRGSRPVFIDVPSMRRYRDGEYWLAHQQFVDQFLNPLLCDALCGIDFQKLYRGALEGLPTPTLSRMLRLRHKLRPAVLLNVVIPAMLQRRAGDAAHANAVAAIKRRPLARSAYIGMLDALTRSIRALGPRRNKGAWTGYDRDHSYRDDEFDAKRKFVAAYAAKARPQLMLDLGCNTGTFSEVAIEAGAGYVVGAEMEAATADLAFERAERQELPFLPLVMDAADPSPAQGWCGEERRSFANRSPMDGMLALAVAHHLAIARNIPLDRLVDFLVGMAPHGVIEFVPKSDPQVQRLLALREDIFTEYTESSFRSLLAARARIARQETITASGRTLYLFERDVRA